MECQNPEFDCLHLAPFSTYRQAQGNLWTGIRKLTVTSLWAQYISVLGAVHLCFGHRHNISHQNLRFGCSTCLGRLAPPLSTMYRHGKRQAAAISCSRRCFFTCKHRPVLVDTLVAAANSSAMVWRVCVCTLQVPTVPWNAQQCGLAAAGSKVCVDAEGIANSAASWAFHCILGTLSLSVAECCKECSVIIMMQLRHAVSPFQFVNTLTITQITFSTPRVCVILLWLFFCWQKQSTHSNGVVCPSLHSGIICCAISGEAHVWDMYAGKHAGQKCACYWLLMLGMICVVIWGR